ncbi:asparagine synthase [Falsiroseomonas bella]|uniref:Asparagine synthase n=1 Tax=Falsiroseomonas bella TaxID=2184016 RepID=A0A317FMA7_9PROT|nr:TylF/MycF/NovP-related O-methyltransferase [Falsiroseomonas bella]PWS39197.1 asparagine synthase [Falsiroseomonas bella]
MLRQLKRAVLLAALSPLSRQVRREKLTMLGARKLLRLERAAARLRRAGVAGDFAEFGMALGGSGIVLAHLARRDGRQFHGFDVFGMIPPPTSEKDDAASRKRYEEIAAGKSQGIGGDTYYGYVENLYDVVCRSFAAHGVPVDGSSVVLHKGLFADTLPGYADRPVALVHVDCDWYDPAKLVLTTLADRVPSGGAIVMDDYHAYGGARTATEEFLRERSDFAMEDGDNVILRRR